MDKDIKINKESNSTNSKRIYLIIAILIIAIFAVISVWVYFFYNLGNLQEENQNDTLTQKSVYTENKKDTKKKDRISGKIYMTLVRPGEKFSKPYLYDINSKQLYAIRTDKASHILFPTFTNDKIAFIGSVTYQDDPKDAPWRRLQVYASQISDAQDIAQISSSKMLTNGNLRFMRTPAISNDGERVLFTATDKDTLPVLVEDWGIYLTNKDGNTKKIANGMYPHWINNNTFLYLKNEGVYLYNLTNGEQKMFIPNKGGAQINQMLHLSEDRSTLVWTYAGGGAVFVFDVNFTNKPSAGLLAEIKTTAFWPILSPNGDFLAVQSVIRDAIEQNPIPRLEFYSLKEKGNPVKLDTTLDLSEFVQEKMFINDWRK